MELVQEIQQVLFDKEEMCHRTCFTLQLDGTVLDNYAELKCIEGLKDGSVVKVVDGMFSDATQSKLQSTVIVWTGYF
jgi:protein TIF31